MGSPRHTENFHWLSTLQMVAYVTLCCSLHASCPHHPPHRVLVCTSVLCVCVSAVVAGVMRSPSCVRLFVTPWTVACQASLSFPFSRSLLKLMSLESVMPSNHLSLCHPLLLLPSIFPSIRVFSNELAFHSRWPKYWILDFSISPSNGYSKGSFPLGLTGLILQ